MAKKKQEILDEVKLERVRRAVMRFVEAEREDPQGVKSSDLEKLMRVEAEEGVAESDWKEWDKALRASHHTGGLGWMARTAWSSMSDWGRASWTGQRFSATDFEPIAEKQARRLRMWDHLWEMGVSEGLEPMATSSWAVAMERGIASLEAAERLAEQGWGAKLSSRRARARSERQMVEQGMNFLMALRAETERERALCMELKKQGALEGETALFTPADLMLAGRWTLAKDLLAAGVPMGRSNGYWNEREGMWRLTQGLGPIEALIGSLAPRGSSSSLSARTEESPESVIEDLDRMWSMGARLMPGTQALVELLGGDAFRSERGLPQAMREKLGEWLLSHGADPNADEKFGVRVIDIMSSSWWGYAQTESGKPLGEEVRLWAEAIGWKPRMSAGALVGAMAERHAELLEQAVSRSVHVKGVEEREAWLAAQGISARDLKAGQRSPLGRMVANGWLDEFRRWERLGAAWNFKVEMDQVEGVTLLHIVAERSGKKQLELLKEALARPEMLAWIDEPNGKGETPLMLAAGKLNLEAIRALLAAGADVRKTDDKGWGPLRHALRKSGAAAQEKARPAVEMLMAAGADPAAMDAKGQTAAESAAARAPLEAVGALLETSSERLETAEGKTALRKIEKRGDQGRSLSEKVQLEGMGRPKESAKKTGATKKRL